jgi:hypothetical protein
VETDVLALVVVDVNGNLLDEMNGLAVGRLEVFEIGPEDIVGITSRKPLFELAVVIGVDFPARFIRFVFAAPYLDGNSIHRSIVGPPHSANDYGVRFPSGFLS